MDIEIIRTNRKTIGLQLQSSEKLIIRAPKRVSRKDIDAVIENNRKWIEKHIEIFRMEEKERAEAEENGSMKWAAILPCPYSYSRDLRLRAYRC